SSRKYSRNADITPPPPTPRDRSTPRGPIRECGQQHRPAENLVGTHADRMPLTIRSYGSNNRGEGARVLYALQQRKTHGSALFALAASLAFAGIVAARVLVLDGPGGAPAEVAARQLAVRIAVLEAQFPLAIAGHTPLRHEELPGAEA